MKINTSMPKGLKPHFQKELKAYREKLAQGHLQQAWLHLERAHIIGQPYPFPHTEVHWLMLIFGFRIKNIQEIFGQIPRLLVGGIKSFIGKIPVGNTGGSNVPPLKPMEIPDDLKLIISNNKTG